MPGERVVDQRRRARNASTLPNSGSETGPVSCSASPGSSPAAGTASVTGLVSGRRAAASWPRRSRSGRSPGRCRWNAPAGRPCDSRFRSSADRRGSATSATAVERLPGRHGDHGLQRRERAAAGLPARADRRLQLAARTAARRSRWPDTARSRSRSPPSAPVEHGARTVCGAQLDALRMKPGAVERQRELADRDRHAADQPRQRRRLHGQAAVGAQRDARAHDHGAEVDRADLAGDRDRQPGEAAVRPGR